MAHVSDIQVSCEADNGVVAIHTRAAHVWDRIIVCEVDNAVAATRTRKAHESGRTVACAEDNAAAATRKTAVAVKADSVAETPRWQHPSPLLRLRRERP